MKNSRNIVPRKIILQSLFIQFILALPLISFFIMIILNFYDEPQHYAELTQRSFGEKITVLHLWFTLFSSSAFFSCMGSLVSYLSRESDYLDDIENESFVLSVHIVGSIFGIMLLLLFMGGFVAGNLFPSFGYGGFFGIYHTVSSPQFWAKLFVWTFIAGFSERLIPNLLTNLASKITEKNKKI
jgi:magnesium-transporting ATPase (P-type)